MKKAKVNFVIAIVVMPVFLALLGFSLLEILLGEKALAKGLMFTIVAFGFTLITLLALIKHKSKLNVSEGKSLCRSLSVTGVISVSLAVILILVFYSDLDSVIITSSFILNALAFVNMLLVLKGLGGKTTGNETTGHYQGQQAFDITPHNQTVNPASGLPMIGGVSGLDINGNSFGNRNYD